MARRLALGGPIGDDPESRWRWIEESLRQIERASHEDNLGGLSEAFDNIKVAATSTYSGVVELATVTEVLEGVDTERAVTPDALAGLWEEGPDITWASTISVGEGGYFHVIASSTTGSIAAIDFATQKDGRAVVLKFDSPGTLVYSSGLILPTTGTNISVSSGDCAHVVQDSSVVSRVVNYQKADGSALTVAASSFSVADSSSIIWDSTSAPYSAQVRAPLPVARGGTGQITEAEAIGELIQALTETTVPNTTEDYLAIYSSTLDTGRKVKLSNLLGGSWTEFASGSFSGSSRTLAITDIPSGYGEMMIKIAGLSWSVSSTALVTITGQFDSDNGASFDASSTNYQGTGSGSFIVGSPLVTASSSDTYSLISHIVGYATTGGFPFYNGEYGTGPLGTFQPYQGLYTGTTPINAVQIALTTGLFDAGTYKILLR